MPSISASGAPAPTDKSGTLTDGSSFTVTGSGFGTIGVANEYESFLDFEGGRDGDTVSESGWSAGSADSQVPPQYVDNYSYGTGGMSMYINPTHQTGQSYIDRPVSAPYTLYLTWNIYNDSNGGNPAAKYFRYQNVPDYYPEFTWGVNSGFGVYQAIFNSGNSGTHICPTTQYFTSYGGEWLRWEMWFDPGTEGGADGEWKIWIHRPGTNISSPSSSSGCSILVSSRRYNNLSIGNEGFDTDYHYIDNIYYSKTCARVEIGDASTWSACSRHEVQLVTTWATDSINLTVRQAGFGATDDAWIYVVDEDGSYNSSGLAVKFGEEYGGEPDTTAPAAPTNLQIR